MENKMWLRFNYDDEKFEDYNIIKYHIYQKLNYVLITYYDEEMEDNVCRPIYLDNVKYIEIYEDGICTKIIDIKEVE